MIGVVWSQPSVGSSRSFPFLFPPYFLSIRPSSSSPSLLWLRGPRLLSVAKLGVYDNTGLRGYRLRWTVPCSGLGARVLSGWGVFVCGGVRYRSVPNSGYSLLSLPLPYSFFFIRSFPLRSGDLLDH